MRKFFKYILRFFLTVGILLILLGALGYVIFRSSTVQSYITKQIASYFAKEWKTKVSVNKVDISWYNGVVLEKVLLCDQKNDTILSASSIALKANLSVFLSNKIILNQVILADAYTRLVKYKGEKAFNFQFIVDYFGTSPKKKKKVIKPFYLSIGKIILINNKLQYQNQNSKFVTNGVNYDDLLIRNLQVDINNLKIEENIITADVKQISLNEKSGFKLLKLKAIATFSPQLIEAKDLYLKTPHSHLADYYAMRFKDLAAFPRFLTDVTLEANFKNTLISAEDVAYFAPVLRKYPLLIKTNGKVSGTISHLKSEKLRVEMNESVFDAGFSIKGLPDINKTLFYIDFKQLTTNRQSIERVVGNFVEEGLVLPTLLDKFGKMQYKGLFIGQWNNFTVKGNLASLLGVVDFDGLLNIKDFKNPIYDAKIKSNAFDVGGISGLSSLHRVAIDAQLTGSGFDLNNVNTRINGTLSNIDFQNYPYQNITLNGVLNKKIFNGNANIKDDNLNLKFNGLIDLNNPKNPVYDFTAIIGKADLYKLKLSKTPFYFYTKIKINGNGTNLENLEGSLLCDSIYIRTQNRDFKLDTISLTSSKTPKGKELKLHSDIVTAKIAGQYNLENLTISVQQLLRKYIPSLIIENNKIVDHQIFDFEVAVNDINPILGLFDTGIYVAPGSLLQGKINTQTNSIKLSGRIPSLKYEAYNIQNIYLDGETENNVFALNTSIDNIILPDNTKIHNINLSNRLKEDSLFYNIKLSDAGTQNRLDLNGLVHFNKDSAYLTILPSELTIQGEDWTLSDAFNIEVRNKNIKIEAFEIKNQDQLVGISGTISDSKNDTLKFYTQNLNLNLFNAYLEQNDFSLGGLLSGNTKISNVLGIPILSTNSNISQLTYNADTIGNVEFISTYNNATKSVVFDGKIENKTLNNLIVKGQYGIQKGDVYAEINLKSLNIPIIQPFVGGIVSKLKGTADAELILSGTLAKPELTGVMKLNNTTAVIDYLQIPVTINDKVYFDKDKIRLDNITVKDGEGNEANATGTIYHNNFKKFVLDVSLNTNKFLALNTKSKDNNLYYGRAFTRGNFTFKGPLDRIDIYINATTLKGTSFNIPITAGGNGSTSSYINFVGKNLDSEKNTDKKLTGVALKMNLRVTNDAECRIIFDEVAGDVVRGRGVANLQLDINTLGDFAMFGEYTITDGDYLFTFQDIIKKKFTVEQGGTISWSGDPLNATINLNAIYKTRADVTPLLNAANGSSATSQDTTRGSSSSRTQVIPVYCILNLQNNLMTPDIKFDLKFPENQSIRSETASYLASADNLNNQVFSLLALGSFSNSAVNPNIGNTGSEFLANQLNNWTSRLTKSNLALDLRNLQGVGGSFSVDRFTFTGGFNNSANSTSTTTTNTSGLNQNQFSADASIEYRITENLRAKAFTRASNQDLIGRSLTTAENVQGLSLFFRKDFNSLNFWKKELKVK